MALDAVVGSATFNAYCDVAFADAYHGGRLHNDTYWCATTAKKEAGIIWATRLLDTLEWKGSTSLTTQRLMWPRQWITSLYGATYLDSALIPTSIKNATAELAFWLLSNDTTAPTGTEGFSHIRIDTIELSIASMDRQKWLNDAVLDHIYWMLNRSGRGISVHKIVT